ncbi:uncharacterized protein BJ171DRAFT_596257 [Polychytrium aggregatum]|uniref:uncharacterized protein n=1 Tax=Polychytrium aggregatum TaxID=110093 RepID=UPI0022FDFF1D|nr:uncharacterized protein BJ171DRAFT_596257 [Polychytrium aggregatum]KAI9207827.1 hypothetical protein BJ171DRAFT_596257 [Polychytrium aggregatum]
MDSVEAIAAPLILDVLSLTNEARSAHGLRHQDYQRYRQYCTRKIERVRKALSLTQGKKRFEKKEITADVVSESRHLEILLFDTERNWSYAMQLKRESNDEPRKHHHLIRKLKKAADVSAALEQVCQDKDVEPRTLLEVQAYALVMGGYLLFERQEWEQCLEKFGAARTIYEKLASVGTAEQEALCHVAIDAIDPSIRYCAYNLKLKGGQTLDISALLEMRNNSEGAGLDLVAAKVESLLSQSRQERAGQVHDIGFRSQTVPCKNDKLAEAIISAQEMVQRLNATAQPDLSNQNACDSHLELFDKVLGHFWAANSIAENDIKQDSIATTKIKSSKSDENSRNLQLLFSYVAFNRLRITIDRNLLLIEILKQKLRDQERRGGKPDKKSVKPEEIVKLYEIITRALVEMKDLPALESDNNYQNLCNARLLYYKAIRAARIADHYSQAGKHPEANALYSRAEEHLSLARSDAESVLRKASKPGKKAAAGTEAVSSDDVDELKKILALVEELTDSIAGQRIRARAETCLQIQTAEISEAAHEKTETPLVDRLQSFAPHFDSKNPNLVSFPPNFKVLSAKPMFFDIAYNGVGDYPTASVRSRASGRAAGAAPEESQRGWFGGLFGARK